MVGGNGVVSGLAGRNCVFVDPVDPVDSVDPVESVESVALVELAWPGELAWPEAFCDSSRSWESVFCEIIQPEGSIVTWASGKTFVVASTINVSADKEGRDCSNDRM